MTMVPFCTLSTWAKCFAYVNFLESCGNSAKKHNPPRRGEFNEETVSGR